MTRHGCEWRPITEAPRNGVTIVATDFRAKMSVGFYNRQGEFECIDWQGAPMGVGFYPTHFVRLGYAPPQDKDTAR